MSKRKWSDKELQEAVRTSVSYSSALKKLGLSVSNGNYRVVKLHINRLKIDISHFVRTFKQNRHQRIKLEDILIENSTYTNSPLLKKRLMRDGMLKNVCSICGQLPIWNNKPLTLIMDHINGNHTDNRIENLRIICRHCDSQLETFSSKNIKVKGIVKLCNKCSKNIRKHNKSGLCIDCYMERARENKKQKLEKLKSVAKEYIYVPRERFRKVIRPSKDELLTMIISMPMTKIGKTFNVSDQAVRKWAKYYGLPSKLHDIKKIRLQGEIGYRS